MEVIKLSVAKVIVEAVRTSWIIRFRLARALVAPGVALVTLGVYWFYKGHYLGTWGQVPWVFISLVIITPFAIACHRIVLAGDESVPEYGILTWTGREVRFLGWLVLTSLLSLAIWLLSVPVLSTVIFHFYEIPDNMAYWLIEIFRIPAMYVLGRLCLVLPDTALDKGLGITGAWQLSRRNGWRLAVIVGGVPWLLDTLTGFLLPLEMPILGVIVASTLVYVLTITEIVALSIAYRQINFPAAQ